MSFACKAARLRFAGRGTGTLRSSSSCHRSLPLVRAPKGRRLLSSSPSSSSSSAQNNMPKWPAVASIVVVPLMIVAWGASDFLLGNQQTDKNEQLRRKCEQEHPGGIHPDTDDDVLFYCVIRRNRGFTHCLSGIQVGDVVEVLQEGVGPENLYNLCRLPANTNVDLAADTLGWFPIRWLQKLDDYDRMVQAQLENLEEEK